MNAENEHLTKVGLSVSILYVVFLFGALVFAVFSGWVRLSPLELNQVGDFLAGIFGPLALFWLILGFFQQGQELRNSIATLKLQAEELANSVQQQRELVAVTREQLEHERLAIKDAETRRKKRIQPNFLVDFGASVGFGNGDATYKLKITNTGSFCSKFTAYLWDDEATAAALSSTSFDRSVSLEANAFDGGPVAKVSRELRLQLNYTDDDGEPWENEYLIAPPIAGGNGRHSVRMLDSGPVYE